MRAIGGGMFACWALTLAVFRPGFAMFDTLVQYRQLLSGQFDDWHPPAMARAWQALAPLGHGQAPLFVVQVTFYWLGIALLAMALARGGRWRAGVALGLIALLPPFLGWQMAVLKDAQMAGALLAATGVIGAYRLGGARPGALGWVGAGLLLLYAVLVRANAVFAVAPLVAMLVPLGWRGRVAVALGGMVAAIALSPAINHRIFGAADSGVVRTQPIYDLAAIAVRVPGAATGLAPGAVMQMRARGCVKPYFWDSLSDSGPCGGDVAPLVAMPPAKLELLWAGAIVSHPLAYAVHRLAHLNSTMRWLVPYRWPGAAPPLMSERNDLGLGSPGRVARAWQRLAGYAVETPLGWPFAWLGLALAGLVALGRSEGRAAEVARALFVSALGGEASFAVVSIASDLRYHLWMMMAAAIGVAIGWPALDRRRWRIGVALVALACIPAIAARIALPLPPQTYAGMLG